jgi:hypothetical protein
MVHAHHSQGEAIDITPARQVSQKSSGERASAANRLLGIQRSLGNRVVQQLANSNERSEGCHGGQNCHCASCTHRHIQTKLAVGAANDSYEKEAETVADRVMRMPEAPARVESGQPTSSLNIQRIASSDSLQMSTTNIDLNKGGGRPLSSATRAFMEPRFGSDFGQVRLHSDEHANQSASAIQARAFTHGNQIWLGKGESEQDRHLLAHELTHVVQQGAAAADHSTGQSSDASCDGTVQREPTKSQCPDGQKTVTVDLVSLRGSNRNSVDDLDFANSIFRSCCVTLQMGTGVSVGAADSDKWLGGDTIMNRATARGAIDPEESTTYDQASAAFHLGGRIRAFYVDDMNPSIALATSFPGVWATGAAAPYEGMVIVTNSAARRSLAHEIGHILLNADGTVHTGHPGGTDNLMEPTATATGETLEPAQCTTIVANS